MKIEFDSEKRNKTLAERGLDFARTGEIFAGHHLAAPDLREAYGEDRYVTVGLLDQRMVVCIGLDTARRGSSHHQHEESQ